MSHIVFGRVFLTGTVLSHILSCSMHDDVSQVMMFAAMKWGVGHQRVGRTPGCRHDNRAGRTPEVRQDIKGQAGYQRAGRTPKCCQQVLMNLEYVVLSSK